VQDVDEVVEEVDIGEVATLANDWVQEVVDEMVDYEEGLENSAWDDVHGGDLPTGQGSQDGGGLGS
jgi:hypothetical protein